MNKSSKSIPDQAAMAAYIQAYMTDPKWTNIFGDRMKNFLSADAAYIQTSLTCVAVNVLAAISTVLGPHTSVKLKDDHYIKTNIYQILVASSGSGKSQAFKTFFMKPIEHVQDKEKVQLILEEFTPAGFLRFMEENKGFGVFASDEFSQIMKAAMGSRHKEDLAFRSQLNKFYNGEGISKFFSTKDKLKIKEVYLTVFGLSQPLPYALFNGEAASMNDGLQDRFMLICAPPYLEEADVDEDQSQADPSVNEAGSSKPSAEQATRKIINEYVLALYKFHKNGIAYELSDDANSYLKDVSTAWNIGRKVAYQGAEDKFSEGNASFADMPDHDSGSKDIEYIVKYSAILHVFASSITDALDKNLESISIPTTIPRVMVERAHNLVSTMREHQLKFNKLLEDFNNSKAGPSKMGPIGEGTPVDENFVQRSILMYPGPVVSNAMLLRKCRQIHTKSSDVPKIMNNMTKKRGEAMYVGQYKRKGNKHIFYKAEPRFVDEKHLETLKISLADYSKTYKEVSGNPGLKVDWAKYYPSLLADKPIDMDTE